MSRRSQVNRIGRIQRIRDGFFFFQQNKMTEVNKNLNDLKDKESLLQELNKALEKQLGR